MFNLTTFIFFAFSLTAEAGTPARGFPGVEGFCYFDNNWKYRTHQDSSGETFSFYEVNSPDATLPNCPEKNVGSELYTFKGWTTIEDISISTRQPGACTNMISVGTTPEEQCRWIDYIEPNTKYRDPVTNKKPAAFRLAFK